MWLKTNYKILRTILVTLAVIIITVPSLLYVALSLPVVQNAIRSRAEKELTTLLGTPVEIGAVSITPFNSLTLSDVSVSDDAGVKALEIKRLDAGINLYRLFGGDIVINYVELLGLHARLYKANREAPLNIQPVIDRLKPKDKNKPPTRFELAVTMVVIRSSAVDFDILSEMRPQPGRFSPAHVSVRNFRADVNLPLISNDRNIIDIRRLAADEQSGLSLTSLSGRVEFTPSTFAVSALKIEMPSSQIALNDINFDYKSFDNLRANWRELPVDLALSATVMPADLSPLLPQLSKLTFPVELRLSVAGTPDNIDLEDLSLGIPSLPLTLTASADITDATRGKDALGVTLRDFSVKVNAAAVPDLVGEFTQLTPAVTKLLEVAGDTEIHANGFLTPANIGLDGDLSAAVGDLSFRGSVARMAKTIDATVSSDHVDLSGAFPELSPKADRLTAAFKGSLLNFEANADVAACTVKNFAFEDFSALCRRDGDNLTARLSTGGNVGSLMLSGEACINRAAMTLDADATIDNFDLSALTRVPLRFAGYRLSTLAAIHLHGTSVDDILGTVSLDDFSFDPSTPGKPSLDLDRILISATETDSLTRRLSLDSDLFSAEATGQFRMTTLTRSVKSILAAVNPVVFGDMDSGAVCDDNMTFRMRMEPDSPLPAFLGMPVKLDAEPVTLLCSLDCATRRLNASLAVPALQVGNNKYVDDTSLAIALDGISGRSSYNIFTKFPSKGAIVALTVAGDGLGAVTDTDISWQVVDNPHTFGDFRFSTAFEREKAGAPLKTLVSVNPGRIVFNDAEWIVHPADIAIESGRVSIEDFKITRGDQLFEIDGTASRDSTDRLVVKLADINLDYIFDTLSINNVDFGGDATGTIYATGVMSRMPVAYTDNLVVKGISYNGAVMGDARIRSDWNPADKSVNIYADIDQHNGKKSTIDGHIFPTQERLDFIFDTDHANVAFLRPFMSAFCDGITGEASGKAHLFGTFHDVDMSGDIMAYNVKMDLAITGTSYWATDSIHITPGLIDLKDIELRDVNGHTALLSGRLTHEHFHLPRFNFTVTDARNFLCYDIPQNDGHPWFGKVFGTGTVGIAGVPGLVKINVDMSTAPGTDFNFVLTDTEVAAEYNFLTFRDATPLEERVNVEMRLSPRERRRMKTAMTPDKPSDYEMNFNIQVTEDARMTLVMDPVGGDRIRAVGHGNLNMSYGSASEDLKMYGVYTLERGTYNFTLQDIIIKDFTIEDGSSIAFHGDPYAAQLNIRAFYALNANLTDLDESFAQDRELNRTNVPVHAMLAVTGDMRSPDISFDLEFPTLTTDTYRKVRSIISTDEMMSRQIIYLLALNRFYTPDYMTATRGNELVSVASSTISSQLSSMLGQLSDKFSIAPTFRSDRGDFSDVEVDVALSSHLLNNRLLFNGNFGYRDKSMNSNSFIGDFDIEYLLNRSGSLRLKAYNRYNDQNYYLKSALTTQGVGIIYKRDFDNIFDFIHRLRRKYRARKAAKAVADTLGVDTIPAGR